MARTEDLLNDGLADRQIKSPPGVPCAKRYLRELKKQEPEAPGSRGEKNLPRFFLLDIQAC